MATGSAIEDSIAVRKMMVIGGAIAIIENLFNNSGANIQFDLDILAQKILLPKI